MSCHAAKILPKTKHAFTYLKNAFTYLKLVSAKRLCDCFA